MSRENEARGWVTSAAEEAMKADGEAAPALIAVAELLGGVVLEVAALTDQLADIGRALGVGTSDRLIEVVAALAPGQR